MDEDMVNSFGSSGDILDEEKWKKPRFMYHRHLQGQYSSCEVHIDLKDLVQKSYADVYQNLEVEDYFVEITYFEYDNIKEIKVPKEALKRPKEAIRIKTIRMLINLLRVRRLPRQSRAAS